MSDELLSNVTDTINKEGLISDKDKVFVAISGGADSVALLMALNLLRYNITALHCNFNLRGEESDEDQKFVENLCREHNIDFKTISFDTIEYAKDRKISIEMAARELRYSWFVKMSKENGNALVAVAHNSDDCIETVFLNLTSGTGIKGLTGIQYRRDGYIIRPLLNCSRREIIAFLKRINQDFRTDSSNNTIVYKRNFIRHKIIPLFEELNPAFREVMVKNIEIIKFNYSVYSDRINQIKELLIKENKIFIDQLLSIPFSKDFLLYEILSCYNFNIEMCQDMSNLLNRDRYSNNKIFISRSHKIITFGNIWQIIPNDLHYEGDMFIDISKNGFVELPIGKVSWKISEYKGLEKGSVNIDTALFDYDKLISSNVVIRKRQNADFIRPFGMNGKKKKVSRILIDNKLSPIEKDNVRLISMGDDILWVIGMKADSKYMVVETTQNIITFKLDKK